MSLILIMYCFFFPDDVERYRQGLPFQKYDAFFLYVDEDAGFANDIVNILESELNLRVSALATRFKRSAYK